MDTPWFHPGDGTARRIKTGESKDGILSKWNAMESKNDVFQIGMHWSVVRPT
jgi:hypothetical protein